MTAPVANVTVNRIKKTIEVVVKGKMTPEKHQEFVADYQKKVASVTAKEFTLKVDCTDMQLVHKEMVPALESVYGMYKESGFNKVVFEIKENTILKMQLGRLARGTGLTNAEVVEVA
jgi:hypothetical protein